MSFLERFQKAVDKLQSKDIAEQLKSDYDDRLRVQQELTNFGQRL